MDLHHFDADPDPDRNFHFDADLHADPIPSFTPVGKSTQKWFTYIQSNASPRQRR